MHPCQTMSSRQNLLETSAMISNTNVLPHSSFPRTLHQLNLFNCCPPFSLSPFLQLSPFVPPSLPAFSSSLALSLPHSYRQQNKHTSVFVRGQFDGDICLDEGSQKCNQNVNKHMSKTKNVRKQLWMPKNELRGIVWKLFRQSLKPIGAMFEGSCHHHHFLFFYAAEFNPSLPWRSCESHVGDCHAL